MAKPMVQWMTVLALVGANLPMIAAGILALSNNLGDHELRCSFGESRIEITLHHRMVSESSATGRNGHRHTWLETMLVGKSVSGSEPDHHFGFARQSVGEEDEARFQELTDTANFQPANFEIPIDCPNLIETGLAGRPMEYPGGLSPPLLMRRGVMMRI
jgi:hypothetical protein